MTGDTVFTAESLEVARKVGGVYCVGSAVSNAPSDREELEIVGARLIGASPTSLLALHPDQLWILSS